MASYLSVEAPVPSNIVPLHGITRAAKPAASACASKSCGAPAAPQGLSPETWAKVKDHPCYSEEAHHYFARMHVAVAPACNIQCNYCNRKYDCANESRPGVTSERLTPEQAAKKVLAVAAKVPQLSVLGIAGPGDSMFDAEKTFATFRLVEKELPDIRFCVSTNGLALPDHVDRLARHRVDHVTVTINMVDPAIGARIHPWIYFRGRRHVGPEASRILHERQMESLDLLAARGILVKVNSVLIPGVNDHHLDAVHRAVMERGAFLHNIIPLISSAGHGTLFGLTGQRGPTPAELQAVQERLGGGASLMRHCRQCRADAVGLLGDDLSQDFTMDKLPETPVCDPEPRRLYRDVVERERADRAAAAAAAHADLAATLAPPRQVAVCSKGGGRVNQHFGHAKEFQIWTVDAAGVRFAGHRKIDNYCKGGWGDDDAMDGILAALDGIAAVFVAKIGRCPKQDLAEAGIDAVECSGMDYIETAIAAWYAGLPAAARERIA
jgi:nitrogen fixation protein NifB